MTTTPPSAARITRLIARRERLTNRRDEHINRPAVDEIDAQLARVPSGQDNRVDLLLGRPGAVLPVRASIKAACAEAGVTVWRWYPAPAQTYILSDAEIAELEARCAETERGEQYDSASEGRL